MEMPKIVEEIIREILAYAFQRGISIFPEWDFETKTLRLNRCDGTVCTLDNDCLDRQTLCLKIKEMGFFVEPNHSCSEAISVKIVAAK